MSALVIAGALFTGACSHKPLLQTITSGGKGPPTLVLLHGFGSSAEEWAPFTRTIQWPAPGRFVFPQGPETTKRLGSTTGGRAWWPLTELSDPRPPGLRISADRVLDLLKVLGRSPGGAIVLGGFSQGAMVASDVAFRSEAPLAGLVLLSGTTIDEASWRPLYARRRGLPVFIAHGRGDDVLPFSVAEGTVRDLQSAGLHVTWHPFEGGHEIPAEVVIDLNRFLTQFSAN